MKRLMIALSVATLITASACKKEEPAATTETTATAASTSEIASTTNPNDLSPVKAQSFIDDVTIGHEVGADGTIPAGKTGDDFAPGEMVNIAMKVKDAPAGTAVKVVYLGPGDANVGEETKQATGATFLTFQKDTKGWAKGDYKADIYAGDEKVNTQHFQIVDAKGAGK
jgi:hypothetical protein